MANVWHSHRNEPHFSNVKNGCKDIEVRVNDAKRSRFKIGDEVFVECREDPDDHYRVRVKDLRKYNNFKSLFEAEGLERTMPHICSMDEALAECKRFYSDDEVNECGVVAIEVELVDE